MCNKYSQYIVLLLPAHGGQHKSKYAAEPCYHALVK